MTIWSTIIIHRSYSFVKTIWSNFFKIFLGDIMNRLKELREFHDLTQERAAKIGFINPRTYYRYENGERVIPLDTAIYYAKYYGVSLDYLAGITKQKEQTEVPRTVEIVPQLMNSLKRLTDRQQQNLADFLNSLHKK